jgi:hypothetical protein
MAGAVAIGVFLWPRTSDRDADRRLEQIQAQLAEAQKRLAEDRALDGKAREQVMALLAEQQKLEEAKRRQEDQARLAEQKRRDEEGRRLEAEAQKRLEEKQRLTDARLRKEEEARRRLEEQQRQEAARLEEERRRLASVESARTAPPAKPSPQELRLAQGEAALARREYKKAFDVLQPLAQSGYTRAQDRLGEMYAGGMGVPKNNNQAYIWYSLAAQGGSTIAPAERERIARLLQPAEVQQADVVVQNWRPR